MKSDRAWHPGLTHSYRTLELAAVRYKVSVGADTTDLVAFTYDYKVPLQSDYELETDNLSFNADKYVRSFEVNSDGKVLSYSGCAGLGLDRLVYPILCIHGIQPRTWPRLLRDAYTHISTHMDLMPRYLV